MIGMSYEDHTYEPGLFTKILVSSKRLSRIVAFCKGEAVGRVGLDGIERSLHEFMDEKTIRKATYGIVVNSDQISDADILNCVSNVTKGRLTCVWGIAVNETNKTFYGCHSVFKVYSTPLFEAECQNQIDRGLTGVGERKKYAPFLELILIKWNPIWALSVYNPQNVIATMAH
jgi:hypothetical protein